MENNADNKNDNRSPQLKEDNRLGLLVILAALVGLPLLGILAKLLGY